MSDPMTNTEVEDVLSSIRRLVSDEKTPVPDSKPSENKLVLTPSLRVMDDPAEQNALSNDYVDTDAGAQEEPKGETAQPGSRVAAPQENITDTEEPGGRVDLSDPENPANAQGPNPENSEHRGEQIVGTATPPSDSIAEKIAILEKLIAARADQWEPDEAGTDPYAGTQAPALVWEETEEPEDHAAHQDAPADIGTNTPATDAEADEQKPVDAYGDDVLDEEALRGFVSAIVRSELQGQLGERITRNVRKLVRREIHRALSAQDME